MTYHARLSPSSSHRWMACAGAPRLEATVPQRPAGPHADLGTAAHEIAETILRDGHNSAWLFGGDECAPITAWEIEDRENGGTKTVEIGQDTREAIWQYVAAIRERARNLQVEFHLEGFVSLAPLNPPPGCDGGTVDCWMYDEANKHLYVDDYKNGYTPVSAEDNSQMRTYALGVVVQNRIKPDLITTTIHQPRSRDADVKSETFTWAELVEFKRTLFIAAEAANDPDAPVGPVGDHCKWCRAKAICPAQNAHATDLVQSEFAALPAVDTQEPSLPAPADLTQERLAEVLDKAEMVEDWFKSLRDYARQLLEQGEEVPGFKLVEKRASRSWRDEAQAEAWLRQRLKVGEVFKRSLVSPYQAEKAIQREFVRLTVPDDLIVSESSGVKLAREDNPKPAVKMLGAADEFSVEA